MSNGSVTYLLSEILSVHLACFIQELVWDFSHQVYHEAAHSNEPKWTLPGLNTVLALSSTLKVFFKGIFPSDLWDLMSLNISIGVFKPEITFHEWSFVYVLSEIGNSSSEQSLKHALMIKKSCPAKRYHKEISATGITIKKTLGKWDNRSYLHICLLQTSSETPNEN